MAKEIAKLLRTEMAADVSALPMLAKLLQSYGRKGDKMLAHITPEEALMLEEEGGSGTINPHTGLPEYYEDVEGNYYDYSAGTIDQSGAQGSADVSAAADVPVEAATTGETPSYMGGDYSLPATGAAYSLSPADAGLGFRATPEQALSTIPYQGASTQRGLGITPATDIRAPQIETAPAPQEKGLFDDITKGMTPQEKRNLLLRSGLGISSGLMAGYQGRKAAQQAEKARKDTEAIGKPYQEQGRQLQAQALRGELTPAGQQQLQAAQAQLAQGAERRGGVGAQQAATQIAAFRQSLLDTQYNYGLKIAQIGDSYAANAIKVGLTQDAGVSSSMKAYTAALAAMYGMQPNA
jgi:hypothetical protein